MLVRELRKRPEPWHQYADSRHRWLVPFHGLEWMFEWTAYYLSRWALLEVLEYLGALSVLIAVVFYFAETGDRIKQKHYQAWQVINTAQGKGGSGGRIEAMQELNMDGVPLVGVDASGAFLFGIRLPRASLSRCNLADCDLRDSDLSGSNLSWSDLRSANFRHAKLHDVIFANSNLSGVDFVGAELWNADLSGARLGNTDLRFADLRGIRWRHIADIQATDVYGVRNAPEGFVAWALAHDAVSLPEDDH
jgi:hypothetical protein